MTATVRSNPKHLWLIEDNPDHALLIGVLLEDLPAVGQVTIISDGEQALQYVQAAAAAAAIELPALVLLDLKLPRVNGSEILRAMRALPAWQRVPVIVLTTSAVPGEIEACSAGGANACLSKASDLRELAHGVTALTTKWLGAPPLAAPAGGE